MKILQINKFFYLKGGAEKYLQSLWKLLARHGHDNLVFSQTNPANWPNGQEKYFLPNLELGRFSWRGLFSLGRIFWSLAAQKKIRRLLAAEQPDIVHLHNIYHQISPSILPVIKQTGQPIVMTVHDFKLVKYDYRIWANGRHQLVKNSLLADLLLRLEFSLHRFLKVYQKNIDVFIAPSEFVKNILISSGLAAEKIKIIPHFIDLKNYPANPLPAENYLLFFGRLDEAKGIATLIKAFSQLNNQSLKLKIVGAGPELTKLQKLTAQLSLSDRVKFVGQKTDSELIDIISRSLLVIVPSLWQETFGLVVLESYASYKPVVASRVGALSELIIEGQTGQTFKHGDSQELAKILEQLTNQPEQLKLMGANARKVAEQYSPEKHYHKLMSLYQELINKNEVKIK